MQIGQLSDITGISRDTLRFYEKRGLLVSTRLENGYRDYAPDTANWLRYLRTAQSLGFTLAEIEADLPLLVAPEFSAPALRAALRQKLNDIDIRIEALGNLRAELASRLEDSADECPLMEKQRMSAVNIPLANKQSLR